MRTIFLFLLLVNMVTFAYLHYAGGRPGAEAQIALLQISPEKVKLVKAPPAVPAAANNKPPVPAVCVEWGPVIASDAAQAAAALAKLDLGNRLSQHDAAETYWVYIPPSKSRADAEKKAGAVRGLGITDFFILQGPAALEFAISLGVFKTEAAANSQLAQLRAKGMRSAVAAPYGATSSTFLIRDPDDAVTMRLAEMKAGFPSAALKAVACAEAQAAKNQALN